MPRRDLTITIRGDVDDFVRAVRAAQSNAQIFGRELTKIEKDQARMARAAERAAQKQRDAMASVGTGMAAFGAAVVGGLGLATKAAIDWETAWAGVTKTVDGSAPQMARLEQDLRNLAKELPATHAEIAAVAEAAGALGVSRENVVSFTRTMINLGETTDLTADQAASALARIGNVMGTSQSDVDRFGAALVELGNNGASTESEIVSMAQRIAGAGNQIGLSEGEVLGFASALSSVGIEAEAGGSAISTFFIKVSSAVNEGGRHLDNFAKVAGMTSDEFADKFRQDAAGALVAFVEGLGKVQKSGGDTFSILEELGLSEIRLRDAMLRTAGAGDLLRDSIETGNRAWGENAALVEEANKRYETTAARMEIARNQVNDFAIQVGETFLPVIGAAADKMGGFLDLLSTLPEPVQQGVAVLGGLVGVLSLVGGGALIAVPKIVEFRDTLADLGPKGQAVSGALGKVGAVLTGPWGLAIGAGIFALGAFINRKAEAAATVREFTRAIEADSGALGDNTRALVVHKLEEEGLLEQARELNIPLNLLTDAILGNAAAHAEVTRRLNEQRSWFQPYNTEINELEMAIKEKSGAIDDAAQAHQREQAAMGQAGEAHEGTTSAVEGHTAAQEALNIELDDGTTAAEQLKAALEGLTGTHLSADEAALRYLDTVHRVTEAVGENSGGIDLNTEAGRRNRQGLIDIAQAAQAELIAMRDNGAAVGEVSARHNEMREDLIRVAGQMGFTREEARKLAERYLAVPKEIYTEARLDTTKATQRMNQWLREANGKQVVWVANMMTPQGVPIRQLGGGAAGAVVHPMAAGGMLRGGIAQVVPPNTPRLIGDRLVGDEFYLPDDDTPRSMAIGAEWARRRRMMLVPMAAGGALTRGGGGGRDLFGPLADSAAALVAAGLEPLATQLTDTTIPTLETLQNHAERDVPDALGALTATTQTSAAAMGQAWAGLGVGLDTTTTGMRRSMLAWQATHDQAWTQMRARAGAEISAITGPQMGALRAGMTATQNVATHMAAGFGSQFARLRPGAGDPIRWALQNPINAGLVQAWNRINQFLALNRPMGPVPIGFSPGGPVPGAGDGDIVPALLTPGEFVVRRDVARPTRRFLEALNEGQAEAIRATGGRFARFRLGGTVERGLAFARAQAGKPYIWGGVGPVGYDCSGFMSDIANTLLGQPLHRRRFATADMVGGREAGGFRRGLLSAFGIGVNPASHTAGTLAGHNVESGSGHGPMVDGRALGAASGFRYHYHLPQVGGRFLEGGFDLDGYLRREFAATRTMITDLGRRFGAGHPPTAMGRFGADAVTGAEKSVTSFDRGGLARGRGWMLKTAIRPERVLSPRDTAAFEALTRALGTLRGQAPLILTTAQATHAVHSAGLDQATIIAAVERAVRGFAATLDGATFRIADDGRGGLAEIVRRRETTLTRRGR